MPGREPSHEQYRKRWQPRALRREPAGDRRAGADRQHGAALLADPDRARRPRDHPARAARHARVGRDLPRADGARPAALRARLRVLPACPAGRPRRRRAERPPGRRHGDGRAAQHDPARRLGDRARGADRHSDRLLCGGPPGQPARPGAGGRQRRPRRDAELCRGDPAALFLLGPARLVPGARRRRCRRSLSTSCIIWCCRPSRSRVGWIGYIARLVRSSLLEVLGEPYHPHRARLWPAGAPGRHEICAEARLHPDGRHPRRRHRRADGRGGVRRDHLQPAGPRLADLRRHQEPQLSDRPGRHPGRRRASSSSPTCWSTSPMPGSIRASAKISAAPAPGAAPDARRPAAASGAARAAASG